MYAFLKFVYLLALVVWVGEIVFFSFVGAPSIFRTLEAPEAGRVVGAIFPIYYRIGYVCGAALLGAGAVLIGQVAQRGLWIFGTLLSAAMLAATLYAGIWIQPRAAELRPQLRDPEQAAAARPEFDRLHSRAVQLNGAVLLGGLVLTVLAARSIR